MLEFFEKWTLLSTATTLVKLVHMFSQVFHHKCSIRKCDTEEEGLKYLTTCMAAGRQRVDTQLGRQGEQE